MESSSHFARLVQAAAAQAQPQSLLFVFAESGLPPDASPAERERFERGEGGTLTPLMCVEKTLDEIGTFEELVAESRQAGPPWQVVFAAGLSGANGRPPAGDEVDQALNMMVECVRSGRVQGLLALDASGGVLRFD